MKGSAAVEHAQRCMRALDACCSKENEVLSGLSSTCTEICENVKEEKTWLDFSKEKVEVLSLLLQLVCTF